MSIPQSIDDLIQLIHQSGIVEEQQLGDYLQRRQIAGDMPPSLQVFAEQLIRDGVLTCFQTEQLLDGKWRGFTIGKYKLLERVGVGGMGQVFLCEHMLIKKRVAVKVLPPAKASQPAAIGRFYREARAAGSIDHLNVVRTHDIDQDGNLHFIVMDYVDGANLLDIVRKFGPMSIGRAVSYTMQVAVGLDMAFRNKIIHRDIKPGNVLVDRRGIARILDMGLARFLNDHTDELTLKYDDKIVLGTADYVAPEQVVNSHAVDVRADIYSLGATLYFLLAGHPPFPSGTVSQKLQWHRTTDPTPIRSLRPEVSAELADVIAKMMAKEPRNRFQTPIQVAAALEAFLPANVPPPRPEEMPQLSPAARVGSETAILDTLAKAAVTETRRSDHTEEMPALPARKSATTRGSPFAPRGGSPWGPSGARAGLLDQKPVPTVAEALPTRVAVPRTAPRAKLPREIPWALIGAFICGILALALIVTQMRPSW